MTIIFLMSSLLHRNRFLILRRITQLLILGLFAGSNYWGWTFIKGNLSAAFLFETIHIADPYAAIQMLLAGMLLSTDIIVGAIIVWAFYAFFVGRAFCSWVCPINMITDLAYWVRNKLPFRLSSKKHILLNRKTRYWILALSLVVSIFTGLAAFEYVSPISIMHRGIIFGMGTGIFFLIAIFLFDAFIVQHGWCGHVCPLGAFYALSTPKSLLRIKHTKDSCTACNDCFIVCPEAHVLDLVGKRNGHILQGDCTNCGRCIDVCEPGSLKYSIRGIG